MSMSMEGLDLTVYSDGKSLYLKFPYNGKKYYADMKDLLSSMEDVGDMDIDSVVESLSFGSAEDFGDPVLTTAELDGIEYDVYTFTNAAGETVCFLTDENEDVKYIASTDIQGNITTEIKLNALTGDIPSNMLTTRGYEEGNLFILMLALGI